MACQRSGGGGVGIDGRCQSVDVAAVGGLSGPVDDHLGRDFGMELDAVNRIAIAKGLLAAFIGVSQPFRSGRLLVTATICRQRSQVVVKPDYRKRGDYSAAREATHPVVHYC